MRYALLLFAAVMLAQLQPPPPTPGKDGQGKQKESAVKEQQVRPDKNQTPPSPITVNQYASQPKEGNERTKGNPEQNKNAPSEWIVAIATVLLFFATMWLALGTIALCVVAALQLRTMNEHKTAFEAIAADMARGLAETTKAANAARDTAVAAKESNQLTLDATNLTRQALILTHRPKLMVRNIVIKEPTSMSFAGVGGDMKGVSIRGQLYVANIGGTRARIKEVYSMFTSGALPMARPYETLDGHTVDIPLLAGQSTPIIIPTNSEMFEGEPDPHPLRPGYVSAYVMGWIDYLDDDGNRRRTAFCRQWSTMSKRFHAIDDPDYEHAE